MPTQRFGSGCFRPRLNAVMIVFFLAYGFLFNLVFNLVLDRVFGLPLSAQG